MNKAIILCLVLLLAVKSQEIPDFASSFSGKFIREQSTYVPTPEVSTFTVQVNVGTKRAHVEVTGANSLNEYYWLIYKPEGADPNTPAEDGYIEFKNIKRTINGNTVEYCSYSSYFDIGGSPLIPPRNFPSSWRRSDGSVSIGPWFSFPNNMVYKGSAQHQGVTVLEWDSSNMCVLFNDPAISCQVLMVTESNKDVPYIVQDSHQKRPQSFESDWLNIDTWETFNETAPAIALPISTWITSCYNEDNAITITPVHGYVATASGRDNFTVSLSAQPISTLGDVTITLKYFSGCSNCVEFQLADGSSFSSLTFTTSNWNKGQKIYLKYKATGETYFQLIATGGGYSIPHVEGKDTRSSSLRAVTCENGVPGYGCN